VRVWKQKEWNYDANPLKNNAQNSARNARISKLMKQATIIKARGNSNLTWGKQTEASRGEIFKIRMGAIAFGIKDHSNSRKTIKCIYTIRVRGIPMKTQPCDIWKEIREKKSFNQWDSLAWEKVYQKEEMMNFINIGPFNESFSWI